MLVNSLRQMRRQREQVEEQQVDSALQNVISGGGGSQNTGRTRPEEPQTGSEAVPADNYGFRAMEDPEERERREREEAETPAMKKMKSEILDLLTRYPELVPRSSNEIEEKLNGYTEKQLHNVYRNCLADLRQIRGMPAADASIWLGTMPVDKYVCPNYTRVCLQDDTLREDVEAEIVTRLGQVNGCYCCCCYCVVWILFFFAIIGLAMTVINLTK